jgi:hypothetical protein
MPDATAPVDTHELGFEAFGVRIGLSTNDPRVLGRLREFMPPGSRPCDPATAQQRFELAADDGQFVVGFAGEEEWKTVDYHDLELALGLLDMHMCGYIAVHALERIFVHAGVAAYHGRLIVMPGMSFAGKSTLVAALVRAGAIYYSDEYAVLDESGRVHPYAKPLSLRGRTQTQTTHTPESLGGRTGEVPTPPSLIVIATYRPGAEWRPRRLSPADGVLALLSNTLPARERPEESLRAITRAVHGAVVLEGDRGEADALVPLLLRELER